MKSAVLYISLYHAPTDVSLNSSATPCLRKQTAIPKLKKEYKKKSTLLRLTASLLYEATRERDRLGGTRLNICILL